jgi:ABC-type Mn2+/Zn2+ transport system ATPase subunit
MVCTHAADTDLGAKPCPQGESGAGKTTLLDVIAGYKTGGHITGSIRINGRDKDERTWKSLAAYCEQSDIHAAKLSVRESIRYVRCDHCCSLSPTQLVQVELRSHDVGRHLYRDVCCGHSSYLMACLSAQGLVMT